MAARIVLLVTSPRLPVGLLTAEAWDLVRAHPVLVPSESAWAEVLRAAGADVRVPTAPDTTPVAELLAAAGAYPTVVWLAGPTGDPDLARELGLRLAQEPGLAELEVVYGSWDPPGARLLDAVAVVDRLASPGGDPWKREQTHRSLAKFLLEECYEAYDAIEAGDPVALREELGDLLFQVVLHARLAEEQAEESRWSVDDVAADLVSKMIRRNPHVFAGVEVSGVAEIMENWERIKREEKARESVMDGIALAQPALSLADKILSRAQRAGIDVPPPGPPAAEPSAAEPDLGQALLAMVVAARAAGVDAEAALRRAALAHADTIRAAERDAH